jgi:hypothetical protein
MLMSVTTDFQSIAPILAMQPAELDQYKLTLLDQIAAGQFDEASAVSIGHTLPFIQSMILWHDKKAIPPRHDELAPQRTVRVAKALLRLWQHHPEPTERLIVGILATPRLGTHGLDLLVQQNAKQPHAAELMHKLATTADRCATTEPAGSPIQLAALSLAAEVVPFLPAQHCQWFAHYVEVPCAEEDVRCLAVKVRLARKLVEKDPDFYPQTHQLVMDSLQPDHASEIWYEAQKLAQICLTTPDLAMHYGEAYYQRIASALTLYKSNMDYEYKAIIPLIPTLAAAQPERTLPLWQLLETKLQDGLTQPHNKMVWDICTVMRGLEAQSETVAAYAKDEGRLIANLQQAMQRHGGIKPAMAYGEGCD